jgi:hypothetical protein
LVLRVRGRIEWRRVLERQTTRDVVEFVIAVSVISYVISSLEVTVVIATLHRLPNATIASVMKDST